MKCDYCPRCWAPVPKGADGVACSDCQAKEQARINLIKVRGFWAARVNNLVMGAVLRARGKYALPDTRSEEEIRAYNREWERTRELKKAFDAWKCGLGLTWGSGRCGRAEVDDTEGYWSNVVRAYEDLNY